MSATYLGTSSNSQPPPRARPSHASTNIEVILFGKKSLRAWNTRLASQRIIQMV